jgi:hypothetical protein
VAFSYLQVENIRFLLPARKLGVARKTGQGVKILKTLVKQREALHLRAAVHGCERCESSAGPHGASLTTPLYCQLIPLFPRFFADSKLPAKINVIFVNENHCNSRIRDLY